MHCANYFAAATALALLAGCAGGPVCNEPREHQKPGWPWHDVEHLGFIGLPDTVAPEPIATIERAVEAAECP